MQVFWIEKGDKEKASAAVAQVNIVSLKQNINFQSYSNFLQHKYTMLEYTWLGMECEVCDCIWAHVFTISRNSSNSYRSVVFQIWFWFEPNQIDKHEINFEMCVFWSGWNM